MGASRFLGLAAIAAATLTTEVALTRLLSVGLFSHLAFLVVSTALLGTSAAGVALSASPRLRAIDAERLAAIASAAFAVLVVACWVLAQLVGVEPLFIARDPAELGRLGATYVLYSLPFAASGIAVAALLSRWAEDAPRLYAADLAGAGAGSFLALFAVSYGAGPGSLLVSAALGAVAAACFARGAPRWIALAVAPAAVALAPFAGPHLPLYVTKTKVDARGRAISRVLGDPRRATATAWSSIGRIDRLPGPDGPQLFIDAGVAVVRLPGDATKPPRGDASIPYALRPGARVLIVGSGAGWEVVEASAGGAAAIDAVEVNADIVAHVPGALRALPGTRFLVDEGRSFLERDGDPYDAIVMIHTISNAATAAGAMHLAEDYLLTVEAMSTFVRRLDEDGVLFLTRPASQIPRLVVTLRAAGAPLAGHLEVWAERSIGPSFYGAMLWSKRALSTEEQALIGARLAELPNLVRLVETGREPADPLYAAVLRGDDAGALEALAGARLDPATDDRPFFHQRRRFRDLALSDFTAVADTRLPVRMALEERPLAEMTAVLVLAETTALGALLLLLPLWRSRRSGRGAPLAYFAAIGAGFMLIEIGLVQRLGLLLGQPALSFATVFAGLLLGAGLGSRFAARLARPERAPLYAGAAGVVLAVLLGPAIEPFLGATTPVRVAVALAAVLSAGFALGMPFPLGLAATARSGDPARVPWAFAVNGLASIASTVLALILATEIGLSGVMLVAAAAYAVAYFAYARL